MSPARFQIITGEYPPQPGGVSDYTKLLAEALSSHGEEVHVWSSQCDREDIPSNGVSVHRVAGTWSVTDLDHLGKMLNKFPQPRRLLVQYAPNVWGHKGSNYQFCRWLLNRKREGDHIGLMVHEPFYPWRLWDKPTRWVLAGMQRRMMRTLLSASCHVYLSIPAWGDRLRPHQPKDGRRMSWLPVPSTIPFYSNPAKIATRRRELAAAGQFVLGSFGTFSGRIRKLLYQTVPSLLVNHPERVGLVMGRGSENFMKELHSIYPVLATRLIAVDGVSAEEVSLNLQACDVLIQPYPDGVSSRRTSAMAGLAHGLPIVTTQGSLTEPLWGETACVAMVPNDDPEALINATEALLLDQGRRKRLGRCASEVYSERFDLRLTVEKILRT